MKTSHSYTGKTLFVGVDVHKKTYSVAVYCEGELVKRDSMIAKPKQLIAYLRKYFPEAHIKSAYEAGFCGLHLHRAFLEAGIESIVVHAASIEINSRDRVKTDKRDALKIAVQLSVGRLKGIHIPSKKREDYREISRLRDDLVKQRNRISVKLKHKANYHGLIGPEDVKKVSKKWIEDLEQKKLADGLRYHIEALVEQWRFFDNKIAEVSKRIEDQGKEDVAYERVYRSVKGIGPTAARVLANELEDMSHFSSERALFSYTGLTPSEYSSGEHRRQGHISRQGKPILRKTLVQCAWVAIRYDSSLRDVYDRIAQRAGGKRAIVAVARRLVGRVRACFRTETLYQTNLAKEVA